mmetsp:Transcript_92412/g.146084  ORF Transcript_92412/g.146084 Transcript_92412/m.146084 type:complete len:304 (+) Transcript_92412:114-1025(+)
MALTSPDRKREFADPRRAVSYHATVNRPATPDLKTLKEDCQMLVGRIDAQALRQVSNESQKSRSHSSSSDEPLGRAESLREVSAKMIAKLGSNVIRICSSTCGTGLGTLFLTDFSSTPIVLESPDQDQTMRRWYRVYPISDELYFVRPDAGLAGRAAGHPDAGMLEDILEEPQSPGCDPVQSRLKRNKDRTPKPKSLGNMHTRINSVPCGMDRMYGLHEPSSNDTFVNLCKICCDVQSELVFLPCKHGGMCESCLRRMAFSRALNREGTRCPWCRKPIKEVIKIYDEGAIKMYGYAISKPSMA